MSFLNNVKDICISSAFFDGQHKYALFPSTEHKTCIILGNNGSGKSTIGRGFLDYYNPETDKPVKLTLLDGLGNKDTDTEKIKIFVFNEDYINNNVKIKEDGLDTIVLLGKQVSLDYEENEVSNNIENIKTQLDNLQDLINEMSNNLCEKCPEFWIEKIFNTLRSDWAEVQGIKISGNRRSATVNLRTIETIVSTVPTLTKDECKKEFESLYKTFSETNNDSSPIDDDYDEITLQDDLYQNTISLLSNKIQQPSLTSREKKLLDLFGALPLLEHQNYIKSNINQICPTCLNTITEEHAADIVGIINNIINKDFEDFKNQLEKLRVAKIDNALYNSVKLFDAKLFVKITESINAINNTIDKHNDLIDQKLKSPFEEVPYKLSDLNISLKSINALISTAKENRTLFNKSINDRESIKKQLSSFNDSIAYYEIIDDYNKYASLFKEREEKTKELENIKLNINVLNSKMESIKAAKQNTSIAVDIINKDLQYIFYNKDRLKLSVDSSNVYKLQCDGKSVKPKNISSGERNALALCYFFSDISTNMDVTNLYSEEMLVVIDDPLSSFDVENRIGITSYLKCAIRNILYGCDSSKIIILTHDALFMLNLYKIMEDISKYFKNISKSAHFNALVLKNKELNPFQYNKENEYTTMLKEIYEYAISNNPDYNNAIGNKLRRALEAFSTFSYKVGIADLNTKPEVLDILKEERYKKYFENLMFRLVLNDQSHYENRARFITQMDFYSCLEPAELQRTSKDILCLIYLLNKDHLNSHIPESIKDIQRWINDIS